MATAEGDDVVGAVWPVVKRNPGLVVLPATFALVVAAGFVATFLGMKHVWLGVWPTLASAGFSTDTTLLLTFAALFAYLAVGMLLAMFVPYAVYELVMSRRATNAVLDQRPSPLGTLAVVFAPRTVRWVLFRLLASVFTMLSHTGNLVYFARRGRRLDRWLGRWIPTEWARGVFFAPIALAVDDARSPSASFRESADAMDRLPSVDDPPNLWDVVWEFVAPFALLYLIPIVWAAFVVGRGGTVESSPLLQWAMGIPFFLMALGYFAAEGVKWTVRAGIYVLALDPDADVVVDERVLLEAWTE